MYRFFYFPVALGLLLGCCSIYLFDKLPSTTLLVCLNLCILPLSGLIFLNVRRSNTLNSLIFCGMLSFILGLSLAVWQSYQTLEAFSLEKIHEPIEIIGTVQGLPLIKDKDIRFELALEKKNWFARQAIIRLFWPQFTKNLKPGDKLRAQAILLPPHNFSNPGSFDTEKQSFVAGIRATGKVKLLISYEAQSGMSFAQFRYFLFKKLKAALNGTPFKGIMLALIVGDKSHIEASHWEILQKTGTGHLVAISGLHVSLIAGSLFFVGGWLWKRGYKAYERLHYISAQKVGALAGLTGAHFYAALAGWSIPTQRAFIMVCVAMLGVMLQKKFAPWYLYCIALICVLIMTPLAPLTAGFWLSFLAVGSLILSFSGWTFLAQSAYQKWVQPQWPVFMALLPLGFIFFQQVTFLSPLANLIAIPFASFLVVPLNLLGAFFLELMPSVPLGITFLKSAHFLWSILWFFLEGLSHFSQGIIWKGYFNTFSIILAIMGTLLWLLPRGIYQKYLGCIAWLPLCLGKAPVPQAPHEVWFSLLDVGQGLSAVIQTKNHVLLYDTGPRLGKNSDSGAKVIVPFLKSQGINKLDTIVVSHADLDHRGGLQSILKIYQPSTLLTPNPEKVIESSSQACQVGQHWHWDGVDFEILSPHPVAAYEGRSKQFLKTNNQSCVLKVSSGQNSLLLTGDIEAIVENYLIEQKTDLKARILVVPHHGSQSSSTQAFIETVAPEYALFPVGFYNQFGFPRASVVNSYQKFGAKTLSNTQSGMIQFRFDNHTQHMSPSLFRAKTSQVWDQN